MPFGGFCVLFFLFFLTQTKCETIERDGNDHNSVESLNQNTILDSNQIAEEDIIVSSFLQANNRNSFGPLKNVASNASKFCKDNDSKTSSGGQIVAGCVMSSLIPRDKTYLIEFEDKTKSSQDPSVCWRTCSLIFPNTTLALLAKSGTDSGKLVCHCALEDALDPSLFGPEVFCNTVCTESMGVFPCGGQHTFQDNGVTELFFSIYCLSGKPVPPPFPTPGPNVTTTSSTTTAASTTTISSATTTTSSFTDDTGLEKILQSLVDGNVMSIVIIGLMVCLLILVLVLIAWIYLFVENLDPQETAAFYRRFSKPTGLQPVGNPTTNILAHHDGYGTTNRAFDPTPEINPIGGNLNREIFDPELGGSDNKVQGPILAKRQSSEEDIEDDEMLPSDNEIVKREGRSTFYEPKTSFDEDSVSQSSVLTEPADQGLKDEKKQSNY